MKIHINTLMVCIILATIVPATSAQTAVEVLSPTRSRVRQIYTAEIGVRETGNNGGTRVETYLKYAGLKKGNPWCAAFVCWVLGQAGVENPRSGWSPELFYWAARNEKRDASSGKAFRYTAKRTTGNAQLFTPRATDIFGLYFPEKKRIAHVGFIDRWHDNWAITVEGNTNISGGREGDGVYRKRRAVKSIFQVVRYIP